MRAARGGRYEWAILPVLINVAVIMLLANGAAVDGPLARWAAVSGIGAAGALAPIPVLLVRSQWHRSSREWRHVVAAAAAGFSGVTGLLVVREAPVVWERVRMGGVPEQQAAAAFAAGDRRFWGVEESTLVVPGVGNLCVRRRYGVRPVPGAAGSSASGTVAFHDSARVRASRYNAAMVGLLRLPAEKLVRESIYCPRA